MYTSTRFRANTSIRTRFRGRNMTGFFVVEIWGLLSQYFMAILPCHPLMFYAIQENLVSLLYAHDTGSV
jgi:hypothetical protein